MNSSVRQENKVENDSVYDEEQNLHDDAVVIVKGDSASILGSAYYSPKDVKSPEWLLSNNGRVQKDVNGSVTASFKADSNNKSNKCDKMKPLQEQFPEDFSEDVLMNGSSNRSGGDKSDSSHHSKDKYNMLVSFIEIATERENDDDDDDDYSYIFGSKKNSSHNRQRNNDTINSSLDNGSRCRRIIWCFVCFVFIPLCALSVAYYIYFGPLISFQNNHNITNGTSVKVISPPTGLNSTTQVVISPPTGLNSTTQLQQQQQQLNNQDEGEEAEGEEAEGGEVGEGENAGDNDYNEDKDYKDNDNFMIQRLMPISGRKDLLDASTNQYRALQWMKQNYNNQEGNLLLLEETYIMVLFYFSTGSDSHNNNNSNSSWQDPTIFLDASRSICHWNIHKENYDIQKTTTDTTKRIQDTSGESLVGIYCDDGGNPGFMLFGNFSLSGTIPSEIGYLTSLLAVHLENNFLKGTIPTEIGALSNIHTFLLHDNQLTGAIPSELGNIGRHSPAYPSVHLSFSANSLTGSLPTEIGNIRLGHLDLSINSLNGAIPTEISKLNDLVTLFLTKNKLTGTIPIGIGELSSLQYLYLEHNLLSGTIPSEIGGKVSSPGQLKVLRLDDNNLEGTFPTEVMNLRSLEKINMHRNNIIGDLNSIFCRPSAPEENAEEAENGEIFMSDINGMVFENLTLIRADTDCSPYIKNSTDATTAGAKIICACCCCFCTQHSEGP